MSKKSLRYIITAAVHDDHCVDVCSEILAQFLFTMRESKLKSYKSAFMASVVNNELFNDRGLFLDNAHYAL